MRIFFCPTDGDDHETLRLCIANFVLVMGLCHDILDVLGLVLSDPSSLWPPLCRPFGSFTRLVSRLGFGLAFRYTSVG